MTEDDNKDISKEEVELSERDSITVTVNLDPAHRRMDLALREQGIDVEDVIGNAVSQDVEQALYDVLQAVKYES